MVDEFGKLLVGDDPMAIEKHWQTLYHDFHVRGGVVQMSAISGIEIAFGHSVVGMDPRLKWLYRTQ